MSSVVWLLVAAVAALLVHDDPRSYTRPDGRGGGATSDVITVAEASISIGLVALAILVGWLLTAPPQRGHRRSETLSKPPSLPAARVRGIAAARQAMAGMPRPIRWALVGAVSLGALGAATGLVLGLAYPPTAWFAAMEVGAPSACLGGGIGLLAGGLTSLVLRPLAPEPRLEGVADVVLGLTVPRHRRSARRRHGGDLTAAASIARIRRTFASAGCSAVTPLWDTGVLPLSMPPALVVLSVGWCPSSSGSEVSVEVA